jgi:Icc-related predicted phosphoesterase
VSKLRLVCISDTHNRHQKLALPPGDILVHAGDFSGRGRPDEIRAFDEWLASLPHRHKVVIAGNHDFLFEKSPAEARALLRHAVYLQDEGVELEGLRFWGSPWQPWFFDWAFNLQRGEPLREKWALIPPGTDVLVTHGPPLGHGDRTADGEAVGCADLLDAVRRLQPRLHVFGHIHEGYGSTLEGRTACHNVSTCDLGYRPVNAPVVVELEVEGGAQRLSG